MSKGLVIVTGGARGIGAAICRKLAADGHAVAVNFAASERAAQETVAAIHSAGGKAEAFRADVGDPAAIPALFKEATAALGPLAGLVNNAGIGGPWRGSTSGTRRRLARLFEVNVFGTILCCKEAVRRLSTKHGGEGGSIVNLSSVAARTGGRPGNAPYAASKGAVESFTRGLATEVGPEGVRVNAVAPGMVATDMSAPLLANAATAGNITLATPLRRVGQPEEIAEAVAWLISPASGFVTGAVLTASGGR